MSTQWSGRAYWVPVAALLFSLASANRAIVTEAAPDGSHDVCLNITHLELLPGLTGWDDLAYTTFQTPQHSEYTGTLSPAEWEMLAVLDIASGTLCENTPDCMSNITSAYQAFYAEETASPPAIEKRYRYIYKWIKSAWNLSTSHKVKGAALTALSSTVSGATDAIIQLTRSAICAKDTDGNQGCISWAGGAQAIKRGIALDIISSAQGAFGNEAVSGEEYAAVFEASTRKMRMRRSGNDVCVSNRPKGCT
ncbi:hypothetical protein Tdes44962_MAKER04839 [Teratosphaeria destructans]|uniref:Uncharacterized protein n=1 Tax=Teratosphaeria destructans TaxID=418781 RepID=A0A9W7SM19_9PEZI|nr:hypothetical protein Tdes44962_MAKER04839 [Teratosphaeria destructans]